MALLFTLLLGISVIILGYFVYYFNQNSFIQGTETVIDTEIRYLSHQSPESLPSAKNRIYFLLDSNNKQLSGDPTSLPEKVEVLSEGILLFDVGKPERKYAAKVMTYRDGRKLLIGVDITKAYHDSHMMQVLSFISIGLMAAVIGTSFLISTFVVSRTGHIARIAQNIMQTGNLSQRIEQDASWDDLGYMAQVLNGLLARIEELIGNVRQVSDNIAHDLRTPLTRLRNRLEVLQQEAAKRNDNELIVLCDSLTEEADHILNTFAALLRIARIEAGQQKSNFTQVQLDQIIHDVVDLYEPLAEEKSVILKIKTVPISSFGDRDMLFQAFANLLDNAIKFTPEAGIISFTLNADRVVTLTDSGPGIAHDEKESVFNRFYRTEASRNSPGNGLGLSLVAAVIALHNGAIILGDALPGLKVTIRF